MATPNTVLSTLSETNEYVTLALEVAGVLVPLVKGAIKEIRMIGAQTETVSYEILLQADASELDAVDKLATDDLAAINAELAKRGLPPIPTSGS